MNRTVIIDLAQNLVQIGSVTKRLPLQIKCDHVFSLMVWDADARRGAVTYATGVQLPFANAKIVEPFVQMFDLEPPQVFPERIGATPQMGPEDPEWTALKDRHADATIEIDALLEAAAKVVTDERQAKQAAADTAKAAFQAQMNERRVAMGKPEIDYAAR